MAQMSESIAELAAALAKAQASYPAIRKDQHAEIKSEKGSYGYNYAGLASCIASLRPCLNAEGLSLVQRVNTINNAVMVETVLLHASGQWMSSELAMPFAGHDPRSVASAITYGRRYGFLALVGAAAAEEDDDGARASQQKARRSVQALAPQIIGASAVQRPVGPNGGDSGTSHSRAPNVNPYTGEEYPPLPGGSYYVWKYEHDDHGWHHGWISTTGDTGMSALEVKTKRDIGVMLKSAAERKKPVTLRYNDKSYVLAMDWYVPAIHGTSKSEDVLDASDIPF